MQNYRWYKMIKYFTICQIYLSKFGKNFYIIEKLNFNFFSVWTFLLSPE